MLTYFKRKVYIIGEKFIMGAKNYIRNPIGIIGLFLVLVEA